VRAFEQGGDRSAAALMSKLGAGRAEVARELAYRLYTICDRKGLAKEALSYNSLVQSWPEILSLSQNEQTGEQGSLL
jgi:putative DNA methylase